MESASKKSNNSSQPLDIVVCMTGRDKRSLEHVAFSLRVKLAAMSHMQDVGHAGDSMDREYSSTLPQQMKTRHWSGGSEKG